jgi:hypothetical protein
MSRRTANALPPAVVISSTRGREALGATGRHRDGGAALGEQHRHAPAHSAARPSDESDLSSEIERIGHRRPFGRSG